MHLLVAVFGRGFGFIEALESAIMAFVEALAFSDRDPEKIHYIAYDPLGSDRPFQNRSEHDVETKARVLQSFAGSLGRCGKWPLVACRHRKRGMYHLVEKGCKHLYRLCEIGRYE